MSRRTSASVVVEQREARAREWTAMWSTRARSAEARLAKVEALADAWAELAQRSPAVAAAELRACRHDLLTALHPKDGS